jgi:gas vesicle protein
MGDGYDRFENEGGGGGSFVMGLLTGTVLGAGLGMLFAPKAGSEIRNQLSEQANTIANTAQEGYRRASETAGDIANKGREMYDKARDAVSKGTEEAQRYVRDATSDMPGSQMASGRVGSSSADGSDADSSRGSSGSSSSSFGSGSSGSSHSGPGGSHSGGSQSGGSRG